MFDKSLLTPCPVLRPDTAEFASPIEYLARADNVELGRRFGLVKVVPPHGWKPPFSIAPLFSFHTRIQKLSDLGISTRSRRLFSDNLNRFLRMRGHNAVGSHYIHRGTAVNYYDMHLAATKKRDALLTKQDSFNKSLGIEGPEVYAHYTAVVQPYSDYLAQNRSFDFPDRESDDEAELCLVCRRAHSPGQTLLCDHCNLPFHLKCLDPPLEAVPTGKWYCSKCLVGTGEYGFEERPEERFTLEQFAAHCRAFEEEHGTLLLDETEQKFWALVELEASELKVKYGADIHNLVPGEISGFPETGDYGTHEWNLTRLPFARGSLLNYIDTSILGMTVPWIYVGLRLLTFCWHVEDHYTLLANYCHFGATKKWYGIPSRAADDFERIMRELAPDLFQRQPDLLHQLVTLISPADLAARGVPVVYADQQPNEFVVTYPRVYHAGFNSGLNFNEAVNFTMDSWLDFGAQAVVDYRRIKKENVFDHHQLVEKILSRFVTQDSDELNGRLGLVRSCIKSYEAFVRSQKQAVGLLGDRFTVKAEEEPETVVTREDDSLCDVCRTYILFQYCHINNRSRRFGRTRRKRIKTLPLTPQALPQEPAQATFKSERVPKLDEFEELIVAAKRKAKAEPELAKRQHVARSATVKEYKEESDEEWGNLTRAEKMQAEQTERRDLQGMSQMRKVQYSSLLRQLNRYDQFKLCVACVAEMCGEHGERAPQGSLVVFDKTFDEMETVLDRAKCKFYSLTQEDIFV